MTADALTRTRANADEAEEIATIAGERWRIVYSALVTGYWRNKDGVDVPVRYVVQGGERF